MSFIDLAMRFEELHRVHELVKRTIVKCHGIPYTYANILIHADIYKDIGDQKEKIYLK